METNRDYIPMIWKKWYSLIRGIEKGWIVPGNDADDTLKDLIINLEAEAGQSIKGFQSEILDLEDPNMVLDELEAAARKILKEYSAAQDALTAFTPEVIAAFRALSADCDVVVQLTSLVSNNNSISLEEEIGTIHKLTSGHSFRDHMRHLRFLKLQKTKPPYCCRRCGRVRDNMLLYPYSKYLIL